MIRPSYPQLDVLDKRRDLSNEESSDTFLCALMSARCGMLPCSIVPMAPASGVRIQLFTPFDTATAL